MTLRFDFTNHEMRYYMKLVFKICALIFIFGAPQAFAKNEDPLLPAYYEYMKTTKRFNDCEFDTKYGSDYRRNDKKTKHLKGLVEGAHFTKGVQTGKYGNTGGLEFDLDYVLKKFPNHASALIVMAELQQKPKFESRRKKDRADLLWPTTECYFFKAMQLQPNDASVHLVIAIYYHRNKNYKIADRHYQLSKQLIPHNPESHYNHGLLLVELGEYEKALESAKRAMQLGYPLQGLKGKLVKAGAWQ